MSYTVEVEGLEELHATIAEANRALHDGMYYTVQEAVSRGAQEARTNHPYTNRTYRLENNTTGRMVVEDRSQGKYHGEIVAKMFYSSYVNDGTSRSRPYPFMPNAEAKARVVFDRGVDMTIARVIAIMNR